MAGLVILAILIGGIIIGTKLILLPLSIAEKRKSIFVSEIRLMTYYYNNLGLWFYALELAQNSPTQMDVYEQQQRARQLQAAQLEFFTRANARGR